MEGETGTETGRELFIQDGVLLKGESSNCINSYINAIGTLCITEYTNNVEKTKYIEWKPNEVIIDAECPDIQDQEWAVVNRVRTRTRTYSEPSARSKTVKVKLGDIKSFRLSRKNQQIFLMDKDGACITSFYFQNGNGDHFVRQLKNYTTVIWEKNRYNIIDDNPEAQRLNKSFAQLDIFPEQPPRHVLGLIKNLQTSPFETTMEVFSKITDYVYHPRAISREESELLSRSLSKIEDLPQDEYELVAHPPALPTLMPIPRSSPLTKEQWESLMDSEGRIQDVECLKQVIFRGGVSPSIRNEVWKYLLKFYPWDSTKEERKHIYEQKAKEYYTMKTQWVSMTSKQIDNFSDFRDRKTLIEKDVARTDRTIDFFAGDNNPNLVLLTDILMTYVMYNFDLGYVQGMNDLLSPILCSINDEVEAFWCFAGFMERMENTFDMDGMKDQLLQLHRLLAFVDPKFASYLQQHDSGNMLVCFRWLLVWFKREFTQEDIFCLWEVLWTEVPCKNFHLLLCVAILTGERDVIMERNDGFTEILKHINDLSENINLQAMLSKAEGIYHQIHGVSHLTDSVRGIIGVPLVGQPVANSSTSPENVSSESSNSSGIIREEEYEKALTMSYM